MGGRIPAFDDHENVLKLKRRQKSPLKDEEESLLLTPFDKPKAKGERKPLEDPSLENMGKLNKQPSKQEIDVNEKEIDGPGEVTNRLETKTENAEKQSLIKDMYTPVDKPNLKKVKPDELDETPLEKLKKLENAKPIEIEDPLPDHGEMISLLPNYEIPTKGEKTKLDDFKKHEKDIGPKPKKEEEKQPAKWDMLGPKETESSEQTNMVLGRAKKSEKNGIKELELKKPQIGHEPESLPSSDLIPIGTSKDEPKMLADSPRVAAGETLQKSIPMKKDVLSLKKETITTEQWQETKQPLMVENLNKPKLKKIRQFELDESPLEELRQHENGKNQCMDFCIFFP